MKTIYLIFILVLFPIQNNCQLYPELDWFQSYNGIGNGMDFVNAIKYDQEFNIYLAGRSFALDGSQDLLIAKYSKIGNLITEIRYNSGHVSWNETYSISVDSEENIYTVGVASFEYSSLFALIQKYSKEGNLLWEKNYSNSLENGSEAVVGSLDADNNFIVGVNNYSSCLFLKLSSSGDSLWSVEISDSSSYYAINNIFTDNNSNIYATYTREYYEGGDLPQKELYLLKINKLGQIEWSQKVELNSYRKIIFDRESNLVILSTDDSKIIKYNLDGELLWEFNTYGFLTNITVDNNNDIILCGYDTGVGRYDFMVQKISMASGMNWKSNFNSSENLRDFAYSTFIDNDNNIYVAGEANDMFSKGIIYALKYDADGSLLWQFSHHIKHSTYDHPQSVFLDDSNNVIIAGDYRDSTQSSNFFAMRIKQKLKTGVLNITDNLPERYSLSQNYPNPFNPTSKVEFSIPESGIVKLELYDLVGRKVKELLNQELSSGNYSINIDGSDLASGIYYYRLIANEFVQIRKAVLLK